MPELRDIPFQELLNQTAEHCGLDSERLGMTEGRGLATFLTTACREMLRENDWPGSIVTERRVCDSTIAWHPKDPTGIIDLDSIVHHTVDGVTTYWRRLKPYNGPSFMSGGTATGATNLTNGSAFGTLRVVYVTTSAITTMPRIGEFIYFSVANTTAYPLLAIITESATTGFVFPADLPSLGALGQSVLIYPNPGQDKPGPSFPDTDAWAPYTAPLRIGYEQTGKTPMLDVLAVYTSDPATTHSPAQASYTLDEQGILFDAGEVSDAWVQFRKPPPRFTVALWSGAKTYAVGDLAVAWPHCYRCIAAITNEAPAATPAKWQAQTLPEKVSESACLDAAMRWLRSNNQHAQANALRADREEALDRASRVRNRQEGQTRTYGVATRFNATSNNYRPRRAALR